MTQLSRGSSSSTFQFNSIVLVPVKEYANLCRNSSECDAIETENGS